MATAAELYNTLSPGRKAALHAEFQFRYAPNTTRSDYLLQPQLFQQFLQTPEALATLIGTGFQPGITPNQAPAQTQTAAQFAQGRQESAARRARVARQFTSQTQPLLALAQAMARVEPGRITTPQFNTRTGVNNFAEFAAGNQSNPIPSIPTTGVSPQPGDSPLPNIPSFQAGSLRNFSRPEMAMPAANNIFSSNPNTSLYPWRGGSVAQGPSRQELVSTVQNGLRLGGRKQGGRF